MQGVSSELNAGDTVMSVQLKKARRMAMRVRTATACRGCKLAHERCDKKRPCSRCIKIGEISCIKKEPRVKTANSLINPTAAPSRPVEAIQSNVCLSRETNINSYYMALTSGLPMSFECPTMTQISGRQIAEYSSQRRDSCLKEETSISGTQHLDTQSTEAVNRLRQIFGFDSTKNEAPHHLFSGSNMPRSMMSDQPYAPMLLQHSLHLRLASLYLQLAQFYNPQQRLAFPTSMSPYSVATPSILNIPQ